MQKQFNAEMTVFQQMVVEQLDICMQKKENLDVDITVYIKS